MASRRAARSWDALVDAVAVAIRSVTREQRFDRRPARMGGDRRGGVHRVGRAPSIRCTDRLRCPRGRRERPPGFAGGASHVCALKTDGTVWCWGNNEFGQLGAAAGGICTPSGYGPVPCVETPTRVAGLPDAAGIAAIGGNTCALMRDGTRACAWRADGAVSCWGAYDSEFFGGAPGVTCSLESRCTHGERPCTPTPLTAPGLNNVQMLTRGCALTRTGGVLCWGDNFSGQLGDGTVTHRRTPAPVVF